MEETQALKQLPRADTQTGAYIQIDGRLPETTRPKSSPSHIDSRQDIFTLENRRQRDAKLRHDGACITQGLDRPTFTVTGQLTRSPQCGAPLSYSLPSPDFYSDSHTWSADDLNSDLSTLQR